MQIPPAASLIQTLARLAEAPRVERFADRLAEIGAAAPPRIAAAAAPAPVAPPAAAAAAPNAPPRPRGSVVDLVV
jgi:hypothetical protein